jgi:acyl carrier protein
MATVTPLEVKRMIVEVLNLEETKAEDIGDEQPLFGEGLGLDSIDALEIGVALRKKYGVSVRAEDPEVKGHFRTVASLVQFINRSSQGEGR